MNGERARGTQRGLGLSQGITSDSEHQACALPELHTPHKERWAKSNTSEINMQTKTGKSRLTAGHWYSFYLHLHSSVL